MERRTSWWAWEAGGRGRRRRRGGAAVELALLLPVLSFITVATIDYSRVFFHYITIAECAQNGAMYLSNAKIAASSGYANYQQAALADATNLSPAPTVTSATGTDIAGNAYVEVTVSYTFTTVFTYPGIPTSTPIVRKLRMAVTPS